MDCRGLGVKRLRGIDSYRFTFKNLDTGTDESVLVIDVFCRACSGARVVLNPIWKQAWEIAHPGDYEGMEQKRRAAVTKEWRERTLFP